MLNKYMATEEMNTNKQNLGFKVEECFGQGNAAINKMQHASASVTYIHVLLNHISK